MTRVLWGMRGGGICLVSSENDKKSSGSIYTYGSQNTSYYHNVLNNNHYLLKYYSTSPSLHVISLLLFIKVSGFQHARVQNSSRGSVNPLLVSKLGAGLVTIKYVIKGPSKATAHIA